MRVDQQKLSSLKKRENDWKKINRPRNWGVGGEEYNILVIGIPGGKKKRMGDKSIWEKTGLNFSKFAERHMFIGLRNQ